MSTVGQIERRTQNRVVALLRDLLKYEYLGNWTDRDDNRNVVEALLRKFLTGRSYSPDLVDRAVAALTKAAGNTSKSLYDRNRDVYELLRYGVQVKADAGAQNETVWPIDWDHPELNHFAVAEEVAVSAIDAGAFDKRPDVVLYVNGIAVGVIELKRSTVSVSEGIRQNLDNQQRTFIEHFFSTVQLVMAGNDTQGLRYAVIQTPEKYYLSWKEDGEVENPLDRALLQVCAKPRLLEIIHDFIVFDAGTKKVCRPNQYFGVRAAEGFVERREGGIIWHTQGSGKSLTMVWLAKWLREHVADARVLIITDRTELDEQIEGVFQGVDERIYRTTSGADLIATLDATTPWLVCSLIHKFGTREDENEDASAWIAEIQAAARAGFRPKGELFVFVDECHRTQSGKLHEAMKALLPGATFIGFTGTPLLRADKARSIEVFGRYIHTYKFDEAVRDGVILDLRYEARDIDQRVTSQAKIDQWFEAKTAGLTDLARAQLKQRWGTMSEVLSSQSRLEQIVADVLMDMATRDRLRSGRGNALLVSDSIYQACRFFELFSKTELKGKCAIVTSYRPDPASIKGEATGEGLTEQLRQYETYRQMLADWFRQPADIAATRIEEFERDVKDKFIKQPGQMKLLIVVDKLLTGFDAPPATYLYIDKQMRDHGLFQAICRVNRLDGDDKEYGYVVDYKDLFRSLEGAVHDYTSGALDGYDREDVSGLLKDRLVAARQRLDETREAVKALCEPVEPPRDTPAYLRYFCAAESGNAEQLKENEPNRLALYKQVASFLRAFAAIGSEMAEAGYDETQITAIKADVDHHEKVRTEVKLASGDYIDLKMYEPAMRHLIDTWVQAEESQKVSAFDDLTLIQLIVERGEEFVKELPDGIKDSADATAETIENNVRRLIVDESAVNPRYYELMSQLLDELIERRRRAAISYQDYLREVAELAKAAAEGPSAGAYPASLRTAETRALYDNLGRSEDLALRVDAAVRANAQDGWRGNAIKTKKVRNAIGAALEGEPVSDDDSSVVARVARILALVEAQDGY
ncbi:MAG TPA: HsdR family type I site-specific deoxyribonuclease [Coriobacteriia bacterium]|nr:HsdR family type I site-specific deoxyribonuclease [Coriobacteriia bacterium]